MPQARTLYQITSDVLHQIRKLRGGMSKNAQMEQVVLHGGSDEIAVLVASGAIHDIVAMFNINDVYIANAGDGESGPIRVELT